MYSHVMPCIGMYYHILSCIAMYYQVLIAIYYHVLPCFTLYWHVLPFTAMYSHVLRCIAIPGGGGVLGISSDGMIEGFFLGLKFSTPGFFWVRKFGKYFFG